LVVDTFFGGTPSCSVNSFGSSGNVSFGEAPPCEPLPVAATHAVPYLLTWNCRHLANATMRPFIEAVCMAKGLKAPIICTPEELMGAKS
jgi:hypothetical protein